MDRRQNTVLITGAGTGIGLGFADAFAGAGDRVVAVVRSDEQAQRIDGRGFAIEVADVADPANVRALADRVVSAHPELNVVMNNAGVNAYEDLRAGVDDALQERIIVTNLLGYMRVAQAFLPHLLKQASAAILNVSSDTAFVPNARTPTYCASKAGIHSYSQSLRYQLADTPVRVVEVIPPFVQTTLLSEQQARNPNAQSLEDYVAEAMAMLQEAPGLTELVTSRARAMRHAGDGGTERYDAFYKNYNDRVTAARAS